MSNREERDFAEKIKDWKRKLADDRNSNPLLNLSKSRKAKVDLSATPSTLLKSFTEDSSKGMSIKDLAIGATDADLNKRLDKLRSEAKSTLNEKGFNSLFLVLGTLTWFDTQTSGKKQEDEAFVSPLLLVPVELKKKGKSPPEYILLPTDEEITVNFLVANKLRDEFDIFLPEKEEIQELGYEGFVDIVSNSIASKQGWELQDTACITLFESVKTAMIKDIEQNQALIRHRSILRGLALQKAVENPTKGKTIAETELDKIEPESVYQICDADSSQQVVIEAAKAGLSFVVQGPPGTGKSQSIANMIAELIAQGKKVVLVAEKQTALEAVYKKFSSEESRLEQLCLNLHHKGTTNTKEFVAELSKTKGLLSPADTESDSQKSKRDIFFEQFSGCRQNINDYTTKLHQKYQPINKSIFELFGELLELQRKQVAKLEFNIYNLQEWSENILLQAKGLVNDLAQYNNFFQGQDEQKVIWLNSPIKEWNSEVNSELRQNINDLRLGIDLASKTSIRLQELLKTEKCNTLIALNRVKDAIAHIVNAPPRVPRGCPQGKKLDNLEQLFAQFKNDDSQLQQLGSELSDKYIQEFLTWDLSQLQNLQQRFNRYKGITRWFRFGYWRDRNRLNALRQNKKANYSELVTDIEQAINRKQIQNTFREDRQEDYYRHFESFFDSGIPNLAAIENGLSWLRELQQYQIASQAVADIITSDQNNQELTNLLAQLEKSTNIIQQGFDFIKKHFPQIRITKDDDWDKTNLNIVENFILEIDTDLPRFINLLDYQQKVKQLEAIGAEDFLSKLKQSKVAPQNWFAVLQRGVYQNWLQYIYSDSSQLRTFERNRHEQKIKDFSQLDTQQYKEAVNRLKQLHLTRWKEWSSKVEAADQIQRLDKQNKLKRGHQRIRQFIKDAPELVTTLKPFWLMSPLAVSQYVDAEAIQFDVVIFDEASQICTEDAVPAIMRTNQVVVVGDSKQLPPSSFFKRGTSADDDEIEIYESLLDESSTILDKFTLKWHYRSKHESLIAFSNSQFYDSELLTFPNPVINSSQGVHFHYVENGIYARGTDRNNIPEAEAVVQIALEHFKDNQSDPNFSLGIVTLNEEQAATIREKINQVSVNNPQFEEFFQEDSVKSFIKPLERVQGDQQEVIIMSFGYGKDENGKIIYNFGLLTKPGGRRRLNVAITRARSKFVLVSSMKSTDFQPSTENPEISLLRDYFAYAQNGGERSEDKLNNGLSESDFMFEEDVYQALIQRGYQVKQRVGRSSYPIDLAVINTKQQTEEFLLGIVCDGTIYHKYPTSRERNRLRQAILKSLGWNIYKIWSNEWFQNREKQINQLVNHIEYLQKQK